ncbi:MAG: tol-pal system protein YbgF [Thermodesulfovibrio sp.]|nr:tol-pal system protein YbgF [Thermodesulfovibrio sp.]
MKKKIKIFLILLALLISGCVTTGEVDQMKADIARLYIENTELRKEISELKSRLDRMSSDLVTAVALKEGQLTLIAQTQDYIKDLQLLKGRFEENSYTNEKRFKELNEKLMELEKRFATLSTPSEKPTFSLDTAMIQQKKKSPKELYDSAHIDLKNKEYTSAREKLQEIIKNYPDFELLPNVYFWIAETYYSDKKYEDAILGYEEFLRKYPKHEKAPTALLKEGMAFLELKDRKTAKVVFERVIERYPKSKEAEVAQKKIAEILKNNKSTSTKTKRR